jgi:hypothetical protein
MLCSKCYHAERRRAKGIPEKGSQSNLHNEVRRLQGLLEASRKELIEERERTGTDKIIEDRDVWKESAIKWESRYRSLRESSKEAELEKENRRLRDYIVNKMVLEEVI